LIIGPIQVSHIIYDAYGQIIESTVPLTLADRLYTGQVFDASSGLYYYNARYYDRWWAASRRIGLLKGTTTN
jgi:hypothetical protein